MEYKVTLPSPHTKQDEFIHCGAPRIVCRSGRRSGKTVGVSILAVEEFLAGKRVLYATPTAEQINRFWAIVTQSLAEPIAAKVFKKNETEHTIELQGTEQRIRAKTAWSSDSLRGDYADVLILDEWQMMDEAAWHEVGAPMLLDNNGRAVFIYTPPSLHSRSTSKARDPQHAAKLYKRAEKETSGRWKVFSFSSHDNPHISKEALEEITQDMTTVAYRQEILAQDIDEAPGAMWTRDTIESNRVTQAPNLDKIVIGVDPSATSTGDEAGIVSVGACGDHIYVLDDNSIQGSPLTWAVEAVTAFHRFKADAIIAESNQGGEMVKITIETVDKTVPVRLVHASRGKATRAEPIAAIYEQGRGHHVGSFPKLEDEMCLWMPGDKSPNRMDALVHACADLTEYSYVAIDTQHRSLDCENAWAM